MPSLSPRRLPILAAAVLAVAGLAGGSVGSARAVVPTAKQAFATAAKASPQPVPAQVNWVERPADGPSTLALRVVFDGTGRLRLDRQSLSDGQTRTWVWDGTVRRDAEGELPAGTAVLPLDEAPSWLLWLAGRPVADIAAAAGVDRSVTSLGHRGPVITVVVGAKALEPDQPQLHFERASGRLVAAVNVRPEGRSHGAIAHVELHPAQVPEESTDTHEAAAGPEVWPHRLVLVEESGRRELVRTWLKTGEAVDPAMLEPPEPAAP